MLRKAKLQGETGRIKTSASMHTDDHHARDDDGDHNYNDNLG